MSVPVGLELAPDPPPKEGLVGERQPAGVAQKGPVERQSLK